MPPVFYKNKKPRFRGNKKVEHRGLEPLASTLPVWRAPSCANAPSECYSTTLSEKCKYFFKKVFANIENPPLSVIRQPVRAKNKGFLFMKPAVRGSIELHPASFVLPGGGILFPLPGVTQKRKRKTCSRPKPPAGSASLYPHRTVTSRPQQSAAADRKDER